MFKTTLIANRDDACGATKSPSDMLSVSKRLSRGTYV